jgi:hypothetical protein
MVDLDIVVTPAHRSAALARLRLAGWRWPSAGDATRDTLHHWLGHVPVQREGAPVDVELHWRFAPAALPWTLPVHEVLRDAVVPRGAPSPGWRCPNRADHLLLCAWHGTRHEWSRLEWLASFAHLAHGLEHPDAERIARRAEENGGTRALALALRVASLALDVTLPAAFEALSALPGVQSDARRVVDRLSTLNADDANAPARTRLRFWLRNLDTPVAKARFVVLSAVLPTGRELEAARLPEPLAPLYYVVRAARLLTRPFRR